LILRKTNPEIIHKKVMAAAEMLGLTGQLNKKPGALSGGQRQRVAMGRAIVRNPKVFLFDEPLSNLDAKLRSSMRREIKLLHHKLGTTMIYVTHDQTEALTLADRIVVMSMGHVQQIGTPVEIYNHPANLFVASFIGNPPMNFFEGKIVNNSFVGSGLTHKLDAETLELLKDYKDQDKALVLGVRPEGMKLGTQVDFPVDLVEHLGPTSLLHGSLANKTVVAKVKGWIELKENEKVKLDFDLRRACFFDKETTKLINKEEK
jgi:multiple sugar transport system ATP-binding protein